MNIIFLLIGVSLTVALLFLAGFLWSVRSGQYEDAYTPSVRILFEDTGKKEPPHVNGQPSEREEKVF